MTFQGYTQETVDFLWGIRFNNERGWFLAHKDDYQQHLLAPTRELAIQIRDELRDLCAFKEGCAPSACTADSPLTSRSPS